MGCGVSEPVLRAARLLMEGASAQRPARSAHRLTPPDSAHLLCRLPFAWRVEILCSIRPAG